LTKTFQKALSGSVKNGEEIMDTIGEFDVQVGHTHGVVHYHEKQQMAPKNCEIHHN
jgi:hypothetical protein